MSFGLGVSFGRLCKRAQYLGCNPTDAIRWETEHSVFWYEPGTSICGYNKSALDVPKIECESKYDIFEYDQVPGESLVEDMLKLKGFLRTENGPTLQSYGACEPFVLTPGYMDSAIKGAYWRPMTWGDIYEWIKHGCRHLAMPLILVEDKRTAKQCE